MTELPPDYISPQAVLAHYAAIRQSIEREIPPVLLPDEVPNEVKHRLAELERQSTLTFVASIEGLFRFDLLNSQRPKGTIKRGLRRLRREARAAGRRGVQWKTLMDFWAEHVGAAGAFGQYVEVIRYRNWLAHGRYYEPRPQFGTFDLIGVVQVAVRMLKAIAAKPELKVSEYRDTLHGLIDEC